MDIPLKVDKRPVPPDSGPPLTVEQIAALAPKPDVQADDA